MIEAKVKSIVDTCVSEMEKAVHGSERADAYVYLGIALGMSHLLRHDSLPPDHQPVILPADPPELFQERANRSEICTGFINRVYREWLGHGLTRSHIYHLDRPLYFALSQRIERFGMPADLDLPTKKEQNDRDLEAMGLEDGDRLACPSFQGDLKRKIRLYNAARNRAKD